MHANFDLFQKKLAKTKKSKYYKKTNYYKRNILWIKKMRS